MVIIFVALIIGLRLWIQKQNPLMTNGNVGGSGPTAGVIPRRSMFEIIDSGGIELDDEKRAAIAKIVTVAKPKILTPTQRQKMLELISGNK